MTQLQTSKFKLSVHARRQTKSHSGASRDAHWTHIETFDLRANRAAPDKEHKSEQSVTKRSMASPSKKRTTEQANGHQADASEDHTDVKSPANGHANGHAEQEGMHIMLSCRCTYYV